MAQEKKRATRARARKSAAPASPRQPTSRAKAPKAAKGGTTGKSPARATTRKATTPATPGKAATRKTTAKAATKQRATPKPKPAQARTRTAAADQVAAITPGLRARIRLAARRWWRGLWQTQPARSPAAAVAPAKLPSAERKAA